MALYNFRFTNYANDLSGLQIYPGETCYGMVNSITSKMNGLNYFFSASECLQLKAPVLGTTSESLIEQILSIDSATSDKSTVNRMIFQANDQTGYSYDWASLASASGLNDERLEVMRSSALNEYSASVAAYQNLQQSKKYYDQLKLKLWGNPSINLYDTVFFSNSRLGISNQYVVYGIDNSIRATGEYYTTVTLGRPL